ncbi:MAG: 30S ribosomal protein S8 [Endomicrobium sp.]|jgi:small subunit ribosomal protein S8|nr:30S ribosomal protein S8 [Endomicrobium sp.]
MIVDPISDMFTRIRNASLKLHEKVNIPCSRMKVEIAKILKSEGYIVNYECIFIKYNKILKICLKYTTYNGNKKPVITGLKIASKPSLRIYKKTKDIPKTFGGLGITIISTSEGILTDSKAKNKKLGGEIIGYIW